MHVIYWLMKSYSPGIDIKPKSNLLPWYIYVSEQLNIPSEFVIAHAQLESQQYLYAIGQAGEYGLWQFLPSTWTAILGSADWRNISNQARAYILHARWIINELNLDLTITGDRRKFLWIWNAGYWNYKNGILPQSTKYYINKILDFEQRVVA